MELLTSEVLATAERMPGRSEYRDAATGARAIDGLRRSDAASVAVEVEGGVGGERRELRAVWREELQAVERNERLSVGDAVGEIGQALLEFAAEDGLHAEGP